MEFLLLWIIPSAVNKLYRLCLVLSYAKLDISHDDVYIVAHIVIIVESVYDEKYLTLNKLQPGF